MAVRTASRSVVGGTSRLADPANVTKPRLMGPGSRSTKAIAPSWAAASRDGVTSVAAMLLLTSIARMIVARSCGTRSARAGPAMATTSATRAANMRIAGTCRRNHCGRLGVTDSSSARLVNRTV